MNKAERKGKKCAGIRKRACEFRKAKLVSKSLIFDAVIPVPFLVLAREDFPVHEFSTKTRAFCLLFLNNYAIRTLDH